MRISDWSSDVCSSDLAKRASSDARLTPPEALDMMLSMLSFMRFGSRFTRRQKRLRGLQFGLDLRLFISIIAPRKFGAQLLDLLLDGHLNLLDRSEEHTSELQSLMRISYAVFCLKKKKTHTIYMDL